MLLISLLLWKLEIGAIKVFNAIISDFSLVVKEVLDMISLFS
jgi:hypothetical protein